MNQEVNDKKIVEYLNTIKGEKFLYGYKATDFDLFELGFGKWIKDNRKMNGVVSSYIFHAACTVKIWWKKSKVSDMRVEEDFCAETTTEEFQDKIQKLIGLQVKEVRINNDNIVLINLGFYALLLVPFDDDDESWRFFKWESDKPHLVASGRSIGFDA